MSEILVYGPSVKCQERQPTAGVAKEIHLMALGGPAVVFMPPE